MKSVFTIDDNGQGMEKVRALLREHGNSFTECGPESPDELRFTRFAIDRACVQVFWITRDQRFFFANDEACRSLGYTREELTGMSVNDIDPECPGPESDACAEHWRLLKENGYVRFEAFHRAKDGRVYPVEIQANFLEFEGKEFSCSFVTDITDRKKAEEALLITQHCVDNAFIGISILDGERILKVNQQMCRSLGYTPEELMSMSVFDIDPFVAEEQFSRLLKEFHENGYNSFETRHRRKDGTTFPVEVTTTRVRFGDRDLGISFAKDITARKSAEELLRASLAEKTVLLKEVHHRVKNNLQIICSLLDLQAESIPDDQSRKYFRDSQDRIRSMALVHEQLYRSRDFASIDFNDYIENLATYLFNSYVRDLGRISLRVDAEHVTLNIDQSIPCGLILNELVSNALKHAFPDNRSGEIIIGLSSGADEWISLAVRDDGVGFPADLDFMNSRSLGLQLVDMLVKQLQGRIEMKNDNGASCVVRFRGAVEE